MDLNRIYDITVKISSRLDLDELLTVIIDTAKELLNAEGASLLLNDVATGDLIFNIVMGDKGRIIQGERIPHGRGIAGTVAETGRHLIVNDVHDDPRFFSVIDEKSSFITKNILCLPMVVDGDLIGVLEVVNTIGRASFGEEDLESARFLAAQAAIAIDNRRLYDDLNNRIHELSTLYQVSQDLSLTHKESTEIFNQVLESLSDLMKVQRSSLYIESDPKTSLFLMAASGVDIASIPQNLDIASSISGHVYRSGDPLLVGNITDELPSSLQAANGDYATGSFVSVPVRVNNQCIGVLNLSDKETGRSFDSFDLRVMTTVANHIGEAYLNLMNDKRAVESRRLEEELSIAAQIQKKILPPIPHIHGGHQLAAFNHPAKVVSGDFYDFFPMDDNKYGLLVADVSGKGVPAAMFMGTARNIVRSESRVYSTPGKLLENANRYIWEDSEQGMFVTLFFALVDPHNRLITYASAGHNNQYLVKKSGHVELLNCKGKPLGVLGECEYEERVILYEPGDTLFLCTDGAIEILDDNQDLKIAEENLIKLLSANHALSPADMVDLFREKLSDHEASDFEDDFTLFVVSF